MTKQNQDKIVEEIGATPTLETIHASILKDAADIANKEIAKVGLESPPPTYVAPGTRFRPNRPRGWAAGQIYRPDQRASKLGGLCLTIDPKWTQNAPPEVVARLHQIGKAAIHQAIVQQGPLFIGLILGEMRQGKNYFDRFAQPGKQLKLMF